MFNLPSAMRYGVLNRGFVTAVGMWSAWAQRRVDTRRARKRARGNTKSAAPLADASRKINTVHHPKHGGTTAKKTLFSSQLCASTQQTGPVPAARDRPPASAQVVQPVSESQALTTTAATSTSAAMLPDEPVGAACRQIRGEEADVQGGAGTSVAPRAAADVSVPADCAPVREGGLLCRDALTDKSVGRAGGPCPALHEDEHSAKRGEGRTGPGLDSACSAAGAHGAHAHLGADDAHSCCDSDDEQYVHVEVPRGACARRAWPGELEEENYSIVDVRDGVTHEHDEPAKADGVPRPLGWTSWAQLGLF